VTGTTLWPNMNGQRARRAAATGGFYTTKAEREAIKRRVKRWARILDEWNERPERETIKRRVFQWTAILDVWAARRASSAAEGR
jgi:hypothetical protein